MKRIVLCLAAAVTCSSVLVIGGSLPSAAHLVAAGSPSNGPLVRAGRPRHVAFDGIEEATDSTNWSGYAQVASAAHTFTQVTDTFTVPTVDTSVLGKRQFVADWVGVGGFDDDTLVQTGIQSANVDGTAQYEAWTEILPAAEDPLPALTISPGDVVTATVQETADNTWSMEVDDVTTGQSAGRTVKYKSSGLSVEAVHERPCVKEPCTEVANLARLAETSDVTFAPGSFSESPPGQPPVEEPMLALTTGVTSLDTVTLWEITMVSSFSDGTTLATPSSPSAEDDGFTVADGPIASDPPAD